jgi:hypothetical protein
MKSEYTAAIGLVLDSFDNIRSKSGKVPVFQSAYEPG